MKEVRQFLIMNKVLITGGLGYLGTKLIKKLSDCNKNYQITVLDKKIFNQVVLEDLILSKKINYIHGDVRDESLVKSLVRNNDILIPLAALVGAPICEKFPKEAKEINQDAIKFLCSIKSKDQKIIFPVTNSGYGIGEQGSFCDENSPLKPISVYGITKVEAEKYVRSKENTICYRLATVFGKSDRLRIDLLVNDFTYIAWKKKYIKLFQPHFRRNFVHVEDVANCILFSLENFSLLKNEVYNFGLSSANLTKEQLCKKIKEFIPEFHYEISLQGEDPDKRDYFVSNQKIEKKGFSASISLEHGIKELIDSFNNKEILLSDNKGVVHHVEFKKSI